MGKEGAIWRHGDSKDSLDRFTAGEEFGVWFLSNPVTGTCIDESWRSEANIISWRYAVLESDKADPDLWLRMLVQLRLPISAIYTSGGKSIHALIRVNADSKADWDQWATKGNPNLAQHLVPLGADPKCLSAVRLTRLPGCYRGEKKKLQKLLYLNTDPISEPIFKRIL